MKKNLLLAIGTFTLLPIAVWCQTDPPAGLDCAGVRTWLKVNHYDDKHTTLGYSAARGKMYGYIDNYNNKLTCIYGGYQQNQTYGNTSTSILPINCEHTVPQSFFNSADPMVSDIHHLFPTYDAWNSVRANYPFADVPDALTTQWMRSNTSQATIPTTLIDEWAEFNVRNSTFEPREIQKGNTARAIFYFYTMYPTQAGAITRVASLETLKRWHEQDPPDSVEIERNRRTALYQGNRNPYIDHPTWVNRAWFCATATEDLPENTLQIAPNPTSDDLDISFTLKQSSHTNLLIYNYFGQQVQIINAGILSAGQQKQTINVYDLPTGLYVLQMDAGDVHISKKFIKK
jgi:Endonuclease I/Secretion system C-terminal sorting domain